MAQALFWNSFSIEIAKDEHSQQRDDAIDVRMTTIGYISVDGGNGARQGAVSRVRNVGERSSERPECRVLRH